MYFYNLLRIIVSITSFIKFKSYQNVDRPPKSALVKSSSGYKYLITHTMECWRHHHYIIETRKTSNRTGSPTLVASNIIDHKLINIQVTNGQQYDYDDNIVLHNYSFSNRKSIVLFVLSVELLLSLLLLLLILLCLYCARTYDSSNFCFIDLQLLKVLKSSSGQSGRTLC